MTLNMEVGEDVDPNIETCATSVFVDDGDRRRTRVTLLDGDPRRANFLDDITYNRG
jgi:hypothetical protein